MLKHIRWLTSARFFASFGYSKLSGAYWSHRYCMMAILSPSKKPSSSSTGISFCGFNWRIWRANEQFVKKNWKAGYSPLRTLRLNAHRHCNSRSPIRMEYSTPSRPFGMQVMVVHRIQRTTSLQGCKVNSNIEHINRERLKWANSAPTTLRSCKQVFAVPNSKVNATVSARKIEFSIRKKCE